MRKHGGRLLFAALLAGVMLTPAFSEDGGGSLRARLNGFEEVPALSTNGRGDFRGTINSNNTEIAYRLSYSNLQGTASVAHIHLGQRGVSGGVIAFLCGGGGKPACPASGSVTGTIVAADVIGPAAQGIAAGEFAEVLRALRAGAVYANVHSSVFPDGEIRGQVKAEDNGDDNEDHDN